MEIDNICYDFQESYEKDWRIFISQFPDDSELDEDSMIVDIKECCHDLDRLIQHLYKVDPEYSTQSEIRYAWKKLQAILEEEEFILDEDETRHAEKALYWFVSQIINMTNSCNPKVVESIWYAIGVDYLECGDESSWMFPRMYKEMPERDMKQLIIASISTPWKHKVETYREMVLNPDHHGMLAEALEHSCKAYCFESAKCSEAMEILKELTIPDALYQQVSEVLTTTVKVKIVETREFKEASDEGFTGFLSICNNESPFSSFPTWFPNAELWIGNKHIGTFEENTYRLQWRGWDSITSRYRISTPHKQEIHEYILCVKIPFSKKWKGKVGVLKPA